MVKISVSVWSDEELREKFKSLSKKGDWDKECKTCKYPEFLHKAQCLRSSKVEEGEFAELWKAWSEFREKMEPIRREYEDDLEKSMEKYKKDKEEMEKKQNSSEFLIGMKQLGDAIAKGNETCVSCCKGDQIS